MKKDLAALQVLFSALAEKKRLAILAYLLRRGERCVCHIEADLRLSQSMASRHLACLQRAGFLSARREGVWVHYRIRRRPQGAVGKVLALLKQESADATIGKGRNP